MEFRLLVKLGELILKQGLSEDRPRADLYLPLWLLAFGIALIIGGVFFGVLTVFRYTLVGLVLCICFIPLGIAAILCWRNQTIVILTPDTFQYTTFLGRKRVYSFADIRAVKQNSDSLTLILTTGKVHIESIAILSQALVDRINRQLETAEP